MISLLITHRPIGKRLKAHLQASLAQISALLLINLDTFLVANLRLLPAIAQASALQSVIQVHPSTGANPRALLLAAWVCSAQTPAEAQLRLLEMAYLVHLQMKRPLKARLPAGLVCLGLVPLAVASFTLPIRGAHSERKRPLQRARLYDLLHQFSHSKIPRSCPLVIAHLKLRTQKVS